METISREDFKADDDACNLTNPGDIIKWSKSKDLKLIYWSSQSKYCSGIAKKLDFGIFRLFFGSCFLIFK